MSSINRAAIHSLANNQLNQTKKPLSISIKTFIVFIFIMKGKIVVEGAYKRACSEESKHQVSIYIAFSRQ